MIRTELNLRLPNSPGALGGVCRLLDDERVNILAMALDAGGQLRLVVDNHVHGAAVLREHHHQVTEREVVVCALPNVPGALAGPPAGSWPTPASTSSTRTAGRHRRRRHGGRRPRRR